jgi:hypothetical protein
VRELSRGADRAKRWARLKPLFDLSLLKMNSGQLGADEQELAASPISRGSTLIAMMQTADLREGNNIACRGKLYATRPRAVLFEREMRSGVMMILKIARQYAAQVTLFEDDNLIQAFTADRTNETLGVITSAIPIARTRWRNAAPYDLSRSRSR